MVSAKPMLRGFCLAAIYLSFALPLGEAAADDTLEVSAAIPRWGLSPRLLRDKWAIMPVTVTNRSDEAATVIVRVAPADQLAGNIYEQVVNTGPTASIRHGLNMPAGSLRHFAVSAARPGQNVFSRQEVPVEHENLFGKVAIYLINDNAEIRGYSELKDKRGLIKNISITSVSSRDAPQHMLDYGGASIVVLLDVDIRSWGSRQLNALRQFVYGGGTLLFASPHAVMSLYDSPLADLIPGYPLQLREVVSLPEVDQWRLEGTEATVAGGLGIDETPGAVAAWPDGSAPFIEMLPGPNSVISASVEQMPLVLWKRFGHGRTGLCAINPFDPQIRQQPFADKLWNHILAWRSPAPLNTNAVHYEPLKQAASRLVGFRSPGADAVGWILVFYFALIALLFFLGMTLRRHLSFWLLAAGCAVILTVGLFMAAYRQAADEAPRTMTTLDVSLQTPAGQLTESIVGLFSRSDLQLDLQAKDYKLRFKDIPPIPSPFPIDQTTRMPFTVRKEGEFTIAENLNLYALKPFRLSAFIESGDAAKADPLQVAPAAEDWRLGNYSLPEAVPADASLFLVFNNGVRELTNNNGQFELRAPGHAGLQLDPVMHHIINFLGKGGLSAPSLVAISQNREPPGWLDDESLSGFKYGQKRIDVFPAEFSRNAVDEKFTIGSEALSIQAASVNAGTLYWNNQWRQVSFHGDDTRYVFAVVVPPELLNMMQVEQIELSLAFHDPSGNIDIKPELLPIRQTAAVPENKERTAIEPVERQGNRFVFSGLSKHRIIDPALGHAYIRLNVQSKNPDQQAGISITQWQIRQFNLSMSGNIK